MIKYMLNSRNRFANPRIRWTAQNTRLLSELALQLLISYILNVKHFAVVGPVSAEGY